MLSKRRAKVIAQNLKKNGISKDRIEWKGYGEDHPIAENENEEGRSKKRRVEFEVIKMNHKKETPHLIVFYLKKIKRHVSLDKAVSLQKMAVFEFKYK